MAPLINFCLLQEFPENRRLLNAQIKKNAALLVLLLKTRKITKFYAD